MGGEQNSQTSSNSQNNIPDWVSNAGQQTYNAAKAVAKTPYDPNRNASVADASPYTTMGYNSVLSNVGKSQPLINAGAGAYGSTAGYTASNIGTAPVSAGLLRDTDLNPYMNPYTASVIDATNATAKNALDQTLVDSSAKATAAGAFGGTRAANADAVLRSQYAIGAGQTAATLNSQNFAQAQDAAKTDIANRLSADTTTAGNKLAADKANQDAAATAAGIRQGAGAGLLASGNALQTANTNDSNNLLSIGASEQAQRQKVLDTNSANANAQFQDLLQKIGLRSSTLGMTPYSTSSNSTGSTDTTTSPDIGTSLFGLAKLFGGTSGLSGLLSK